MGKKKPEKLDKDEMDKVKGGVVLPGEDVTEGEDEEIHLQTDPYTPTIRKDPFKSPTSR